MQSSISDKIAVLLAWVLVHTAIGIGFMHVYALINDAIIMVLAYIVNFYVSYKWSSKMIDESKRVFNYNPE
jgi:putative flippase GtrA